MVKKMCFNRLYKQYCSHCHCLFAVLSCCSLFISSYYSYYRFIFITINQSLSHWLSRSNEFWYRFFSSLQYYSSFLRIIWPPLILCIFFSWKNIYIKMTKHNELCYDSRQILFDINMYQMHEKPSTNFLNKQPNEHVTTSIYTV